MFRSAAWSHLPEEIRSNTQAKGWYQVHKPSGEMSGEKTCHVLPHEAADGPTNMALDEALLETVAGGADTAYLRTYSWTTPTLSLGYFQRMADVHADPRFQSVPIVRRLTGGGAIWHDNEITYALVVPASHPLARPSTKLYQAVHSALASALVNMGISAVRRGNTTSSAHVDQKQPLLCFTDPDPEDIVTKGIKLVGSAQRRRGGAVLQHGSLLLARSSRTPELPGICDVADESASNHDWSFEVQKRIPVALGLLPVKAKVPAGARSRAAELRHERYQNPAWTGLR
jgi:lipoyl(octanoyl) transferase